MTDVDQVLSREVRRGMTREELLRRAAALGLVVSAASFGPLTEAAFSRVNAKRGGTFRLAVSGGTQDFIDGQHIVAKSDIARLMTGWESLLYFDENLKIRPNLAEEVKIEKANQYLIRLRQGVEFHNGKTLDADDLIYSIKRTANAKLGLFGNGAFQVIDLKKMKKLDNRTVRVFLKRPDVTLIETFAQYFQGVVPNGYAPKSFRSGPLHTIGTGPFKLQSFTPGRQSVHVRNENYWRSGQPYFDQVVLTNFPDDSSKVNALLSGQIDAMTDIPFAQVPVVKKRSNMKVYISQTGAWTPITMAIDQPPFDNVLVRRAFRLLANRPQMVAQGLSGYGRVANDIYSPFDQFYFGDNFPQREYDPDRARALLRTAGQQNLNIDIYTTPADTGMVEGATIFAENAKAGGVTVNVKNVDGGTFYGDQYLKWTFATDYWGTRNYLPQVAFGSLKGAAFNETHWETYEKYSRFKSLYDQAVAAVDPKKRGPLIREMQRMEYDDGGHIVWGFKNLTDAYSTKLGGFKADRGTLNLNKYGNGFRTIYFV
jgi:peptide/nickel transport system substrate-binding protein